MDEARTLKHLTDALAALPAESAALRPVLDEAVSEQRKLHSQLRKISRIGDRYQEQLRDLNQELATNNGRLSQALTEVKTLQGFIPICGRCKRIRDDDGYWDQIEAYISRHSDAVFSHGVCPECAKLLFPEVYPRAGEAAPVPSQPLQVRAEEQELLTRLDTLRDDPGFQANPLSRELGTLGKRHLVLLRRLEKIAKISDGYQHQLKKANIALTKASNTDLLTGLPNRRAIAERIEGELDRAARGRSRPALLMGDVDHFKHINDTFGHEVGDQVLQALAGAMKGAIRGYDTCARWGGEEFLVLLPETDLPAALGVGEKLLAAASAGAGSTGLPLPSVTLSVGVAVHRKGETFASLLRRADDAMYEAKRQGRSRVMAAPD